MSSSPSSDRSASSEPRHHASPDLYDQYDDPLFLSTDDQPHLQLTSYLFEGSNFLDWRRDVLMALTAKNKDGFLTGECSAASLSAKKRSQWTRCDLMVLRWLLNSLAKPIRANILYAKSSKELWSDLSERYGQLDGLELYQLKKEVNNFSQDNTSLVDYYGHLKRTWESIDSLDPLPECSCGALKVCTCQLMKKFLDRETHSKLVQLLMGLNSGYESVTTHILSMDPLPPINKALGLLQKIERHKMLGDDQHIYVMDATAYTSTLHDSKSSSASGVKRLRLSKDDRSVRECTHCFRKGHIIEDCFKLKVCSFCNTKGHIKEHCYKFKALAAKAEKNSRGCKRNANNADVVSGNSPLDDYPVYQPSSQPHELNLQQVMSTDVVQGIVHNVMNQVLQALHDKVSSSDAPPHHSVNSAGPFQ